MSCSLSSKPSHCERYSTTLLRCRHKAAKLKSRRRWCNCVVGKQSNHRQLLMPVTYSLHFSCCVISHTTMCQCRSHNCHVSAAAKDAPQLSTLSLLLNTDQSRLPGIIRQLLEPFAAHFTIPTPLSALPINSDGTPQWRYNSNALLEYHIDQPRSAPRGQVLRTAGLLAQPKADSGCPAAPSLTRSRVSDYQADERCSLHQPHHHSPAKSCCVLGSMLGTQYDIVHFVFPFFSIACTTCKL